MHGPNVVLLPGKMAVDRVGAYVQNLGIERGELLKTRVERRQLLPSSRGPVQRVEGHDYMFLPAKIAKLDL